MTKPPRPRDFHQTLECLGAATYSPHRFNFSIDLNPLVRSLSPTAAAFFRKDIARIEHDGRISPEQLYESRWQDHTEVISDFLKLEETAQVELLTLYTVPLHESRHHIDLMTTPFGVRFYTSLAQEYMTFQDSSPFLLENQEVISPGALGDLADRLARVNAEAPANWRASWSSFRATVESLLATVDTRGLEPDRSRAIELDEPPVPVSGIKFYPVSLFGRSRSYRVDRKLGWYMRASTLLEGRAVIQSLLWIIDSLGAETPVTNNLLRSYLYANYGPGTAYDYLFLLDLTAAWLGDLDFDQMLQRPTITVLSMLHLVDNAAWYALNAGFHSDPNGDMRVENIFVRFLFALRTLHKAFGEQNMPPYDILVAAEGSDTARESGVLPTPLALESAVTVLERVNDRLGGIWQPQMARHFGEIFSVLTSVLNRRRVTGLAFGAGAPANGVGIQALDNDTYVDLFRAYTPEKWVDEWFDFRNRCLFTPTSSRMTLTYLREQFGLAEVAVNCECGSMLSQAVPKWRISTTVICPNCGRRHPIAAGDVTPIFIPEDVEDELAGLVESRGDEPTGE